MTRKQRRVEVWRRWARGDRRRFKARKMSSEACLEYIETGELVELTPASIRRRKRHFKGADRRRQDRSAKDRAKAAIFG